MFKSTQAADSFLISRIIFILFAGTLIGTATIGCASAPKPQTGAFAIYGPTVSGSLPASGALVLMTDFGLADGAVSAMKGVARDTAPAVHVSDLTHEIPPYNIWEAAYRLEQTYRYWPKGTVFVSVIDPGVGSERKSIAALSKSGHIFVGPDNGLMTFIDDVSGLEKVVTIDESRQRLKGSEESYTFHGRDLYVYVGARLAGGMTSIDALGSAQTGVVKLPYQKTEFVKGEIHSTIPVLDPNYGNVWSEIPKKFFDQHFSGAKKVRVRIPKAKYDQVLPVASTFAAVPKGKALVYFNSLMNLSVALNQGDFARFHKVKSGPDWKIIISLE